MATCKCRWRFPFEDRTDRRKASVDKRTFADTYCDSKEPKCGKRSWGTDNFRCVEFECIRARRFLGRWRAILHRRSWLGVVEHTKHHSGRCNLHHRPSFPSRTSFRGTRSNRNVSPTRKSIHRPNCRPIGRQCRRTSSAPTGHNRWHTKYKVG